ncbi:hypothetical protein [Pauljensenia hongkongensis]|uniref:Uncharacterized protein n=1 Tax=Pauljensenia hongkongensis TaxID=178339 RepID=A0A1D8B3S9_9ACTO|nr:hypothetical protein [Pauljensenia hongkongensis]AOS47795.1 hypothetical protein BH719_08025 [Pauljensenia hongkongensis]EFW09287.1 hypothetical protein HMPREF9005_1717 [Actinomyces sp. oral taxon 178 str. F0338]
MDLSVKYETLQLSQQLLERQATTHLTNIQSFMGEWCRMEPGQAAGIGTRIAASQRLKGTQLGGSPVGKVINMSGKAVAKGVLFMLFIPINEAIVSIGEGAMDLLITCHQGAADKLNQTIDTYADADKAAHEALMAILQSLGGSATPFEDPRDSPAQLGDARTKAGPHYGGPDPRVDQQLSQDAQEAGEYLSTLKDRASQRLSDARSSDRSVAESQDASSYLVPPEAPTSEMENLRWSAGAIAGSIDWAIEKLTGVSLLNDVVFKYFVGDWRLVNMAKSAWGEIGDALVAVGQNDSEVLPALAEWTGKGSEVTNLFIAALSKATTSLSSATGVMSLLLTGFQLMLKESAKEVGESIRVIANTVALMVAQSAIPVAGWVTAGATAIARADMVIKRIRKIYTIVNMIVDVIESFVRGRAQMLEVQNTMSNLAEAAVRGVAARV